VKQKKQHRRCDPDGRPLGPKQLPPPTPAEIAAACEQIRSGWSAAEQQRRKAALPNPGTGYAQQPPAAHWTPPAYRLDSSGEGLEPAD
jgi:hypothetical protein